LIEKYTHTHTLKSIVLTTLKTSSNLIHN